MIRPTMARPIPVPLALVVASTVLKARCCCSAAHAFAGVLEGHRHVRRRQGPGPDGQRAAVGHGLGGVENQIQKRLLQLRRVAQHERQVGLQIAHQPDALVGQLVPHQQAQFVHQAVQVHRRKLRLRGARKVQNLLHDLVQVLDLGLDDLRVLGSRVFGARTSNPANDTAASSP